MNQMMKTTLLALALMACYSCSAQRYMTRNGNVNFFSETPIENIEATNDMVSGLLTDEGRFAFRVPILGFRFEKALMEEHFNENYMESTRYPNGTFEGSIDGWKESMKDGQWHEVIAQGVLEIHGVKNAREIPSKIKWSDSAWKIQTTFTVATANHEIPVPKMVRNKIAESIDVSVELTLTAQ